MSKKKLSIIVPCYKVEKYLPRCLDTLANQTLDDIEVICINDGSPDRCLEILRDYERRYPDTIVIIDKDNEGVWRGRRDGVALARGEYIGFVDSDDYVELDFAEKLYTAAKAENADIAVCGFERIDLDSGHVMSREMCKARSSFSISEDPGRLVELNAAPWNKIFRAPILKGMGDLEAPPPIFDDLVFHLLACLEATSLVTFVPAVLVHYMVRSDSIINSARESQADAVFDAFTAVRNQYRQAGVSADMLYALDAEAFLHLGISLLFRLSNDPSCNMAKAIEKHTRYLDKEFSSWRHSPYINLPYAASRKGSYWKLLIVQKVYKLHAMPAFFAVYKFVINRLKIDIKW